MGRTVGQSDGLTVTAVIRRYVRSIGMVAVSSQNYPNVMMPYQRLTAWQSAHELALAVYRVTDGFPKQELYGLTSQLRRAAFSVAANIAEGVAKRGNGEFRRFLDIAIGSLSEISYAGLLAKDLGILAPEGAKEIEDLRERTSKLTWGLYKSITRGAKRSATAA